VSAHWIERLSDYQDGELSSAERAACEAHLAECTECRTVLAEIQLVTSSARADAEIAPPRDLWPGILSRIQTGAAVPPAPIPFGAKAPAGRRISFTLPQLALAATLLVAVSSGVAYVAAGRMLNQPAAPEPTITAVAEPMMAPSSDIVPANFGDAQFDRAVSDLEQVLEEQREKLDPGTVIAIERNLATIDEAIRQARAALEADPANIFLNSHLADSRRRKLDLLRQAATLGSAGGD
jgi:anti-sigma factor RsiW